jgi:hypothetical protein
MGLPERRRPAKPLGKKAEPVPVPVPDERDQGAAEEPAEEPAPKKKWTKKAKK